MWIQNIVEIEQYQLYINRIICYPFNFYIYPLSVKQSDSIKFSFQSASLNFLAKNQFDFNKLFYQYIPYISQKQIQKYKQQKQQNQLLKELMRLDQVHSPTTKAFLNINLPLVKQWISGINNEVIKNKMWTTGTPYLLAPTPPLKISIKYIKYKTYKLLIDQIQRLFPSIQFEFTFDSQEFYNRTQLIIKKKQILNVQDKLFLQTSEDNKQKIQENQLDLENSNQIPLMNQILNLIVQRKIPLIVHNGFLDLMHIFNRFFQSLPLNYQTYILKLHEIFPYIYDTKFICNNYPTILNTLQRQTDLSSCFTRLKQDKIKRQYFFINYAIQNRSSHYKEKQRENQFYKIEIDKNHKQYKLDQSNNNAGKNQFDVQSKNEENKQDQTILKTHEAGYDALMTGYVFFRAMNMLKKPLHSLLEKDFHTRGSLMRNRIPLGNIRIPLHLQPQINPQTNKFQAKSDCYSQHANMIFSFTLLTQQPILFNQQKITDFFQKQQNLDGINIYWKNQNKKQFYLVFIQKENQKKFIEKYLNDQIDYLGLVELKGLGKFLIKGLKEYKGENKDGLEKNQKQIQKLNNNKLEQDNKEKSKRKIVDFVL